MKGHPRLWVIRCSGPVGQHQLPDPAPSIPSTESTREQDLSDDLFHEPEAQPKSVTAEALSRNHPTWPPAQHKRLPVVIQAQKETRPPQGTTARGARGPAGGGGGGGPPPRPPPRPRPPPPRAAPKGGGPPPRGA